ncbi:MAG: flagellar hook-associated protein FlgK [Clostridia bacterium]
MSSSFRGLGIGISAIFANQRALDVAGHNISNVNTPGYTRQMISNSSSFYQKLGQSGNGKSMQVGYGVDVQEIKQYRDEFLDRKIKRENCDLGYWDARQFGISELEAIFNDSTDEGLQSVMNNFWNSWEQLSKPTGGLTARAIVKESAISFVESVKHMDSLLVNYRKSKDTEIIENVGRVNDIAKRIAQLNMDIKKVESHGVVANDYRDERENLIDELSGLTKIQIVNSDELKIAIEGRMLVDDTQYDQIQVVPDPNLNGFAKLTWKSTGEDTSIAGGKITSLFEARDELVFGFKAKLNELVKGVAAEVNTIHFSGYGTKDAVHRNFFVNELDGSGNDIDISNISFNPDLNSFDNIASGETAYNLEDNQIALKIAELRHQDVFSSDKYETDSTLRKNNFDEFYRGIISDLGNKGQEAVTAAKAQKLLIEQVEYRRQSVSAVSMDEEMSNLIRYEHSYNAAARIVNTMDEMLDIIINKIGIVGR